MYHEDTYCSRLRTYRQSEINTNIESHSTFGLSIGLDQQFRERKMSSTLGTIDNPIRCQDPRGEREYLEQLISETHGFIQYDRMGSFHTDGNILDGYAIMDLAGQKFAELYFDMYHPDHVEESLPDGYLRIDPDELSDQVFSKMRDWPRASEEMREQIVISEDSHGYILAKAQRLLLCGPLYYQSQDYFSLPRKEWNWIGIVDASRQLVEQFAGRLEGNPICVPNASTAGQLLQTFHFVAANNDILDSTDEPVIIDATHHVTEETLQFWFQRNTMEIDNP